jgi:imidazoleglycerol-phosphate dehydratase
MSQIGTIVASGERWATVTRSTRETQITVTLKLDGTGETSIETGVGFFDHLLDSLAHHALFDLEVQATGDLVIDEHHTVEDVALVIGAALAAALADRSGIVRFGDAAVPMDESIATAVVDVGGRPYAVIDLPFKGKRAGKMPLELIEHVFESLARAGGVTLHIKGKGRNDHHLAEAAFKALGRALRPACAIDPRRRGAASTKGALG